MITTFISIFVLLVGYLSYQVFTDYRVFSNHKAKKIHAQKFSS